MQTRMVRSNVDVCFSGGVLNPQPLTSSILTPGGFVKISELKAGDEVCGLGDTTQTITHYDLEGEKDCIRLTLADGSSAESALDHKWWILKDGNEMTAISFELLESFQICQERGTPYDVSIFRYIDKKPIPVKLVNVEDIGKREVACIGVSNEDQLYITDDYLITKNCGKAQPLSAKVLTPHGYVTMGSIKRGMLICDTEGGVQKVLQVYEKGERQVYEVRTAQGGAECCGEHLWEVFDADLAADVVISTDEMIKTFRDGKYYLKCPKPIHFENHGSQPLPPYMLGRIVMNRKVHRSKEVNAKLRALGLGSRRPSFIPPQYIITTIENRQSLLLAILRSGIRGTSGNNYYVKVKKGPLVRGIMALVLSLGGMAYYVAKDSSMHINLPDADIYDFGHNPNKEEAHPSAIYRKITGIYLKGVEPCRCILVSSKSHLYITDHYLPTHNTFGAILMVAEPSLDPRFRACFTRRNLGNLKAGGGIVDDFKTAYSDYVHITTSENPRVSFPSGAFVDCLHIADEDPDKLMERAKGWQYDLFYLDELTSYAFSTFRIVGTRCRGKAAWTGKIRGSTNPKRSHWVRKMLGWYIGIDGFIIPERDGVVRFYFQTGDDIDGLVWGSSKEEVYQICKATIDRKLKSLGNKNWDYRNLVRSFVFYSGKMSENKASVGHNESYAGAVAAVGGARAEQLIEGNWNVDETEDNKAPISSGAAQAIFTNDCCRNGDKWLTVDLADVGANNLLALAWDGFHVEDFMALSHSTPPAPHICWTICLTP